MTLSLVVLSLVTLQRGCELWLAKHNTKRLIRMGAHEVGAAHYPLIVLVHALWLAALWCYAPSRALEWPWLGLFLLLQIGRVWVISTLGQRWTTRIIILPGAPPVRSGPYRFLNHPNYLIVIGEIVSLPLAFGLWRIALLFSILNAAVLSIRIHEENRALAG